MTKAKKVMLICLSLVLLVHLIAFGFFPVKKAVYENNVENMKEEDYFWYWRLDGRKGGTSNIFEYVYEPDRPHWKLSGSENVGTHRSSLIYYKIWWNSPMWWLNSNFDPKKTENYFAVKYNWLKDPERKEGYSELPIAIVDWAPIYPIRRSGWLASRLLPDDRLVIWDFIGWRACW